MSERALDVLFVNPDSSATAYQGLAATYSAIEPPTWALLLAQSCRAKCFGVAIMDCDAEKLSLEAAVQRVKDLKPRLFGGTPIVLLFGFIALLALVHLVNLGGFTTGNRPRL